MPPIGFYDVADESSIVEQPKFPTTIEEMEGERRADREARLRKQDIAKNKIAWRQDAPSAILQANKVNAPETYRKRPKMNLPTPQIPDYELQHIAKMGLPDAMSRNDYDTSARKERYDYDGGRKLDEAKGGISSKVTHDFIILPHNLQYNKELKEELRCTSNARILQFLQPSTSGKSLLMQ
ncbi:unnamed protein product [Lactuca virosa]|uniref:Pre-mRNA-splicing factor SLU7 n=1 Tax=Lactuca virosa TaxID=75947 RepID=A0AAU9MHE6_9ASTR|nr:unnamed protein product [Lactuca virosa]CAH1425611.1 unnamed protein product [Lactuca virosa]